MTKNIKIKISEGGCGAPAPHPASSMPNAHNGEEGRMHRTTLAHLSADVKVLLDLIRDGDDLPEWLEAKITKAGDYMSAAARYIAGNIARDQGQLEENVEVSRETLEAQIRAMFTDEELQDLIMQKINSQEGSPT